MARSMWAFMTKFLILCHSFVWPHPFKKSPITESGSSFEPVYTRNWILDESSHLFSVVYMVAGGLLHRKNKGFQGSSRDLGSCLDLGLVVVSAPQ